jgi:AcrR family transcriptional regulator
MASISKTPEAAQRLRPGPNGLQRGQVTGIQRGRMLAATVQAIEEAGYARMTVAQVVSRAKVSRKTFYEVFADREDCFLAAFEQVLSQARVIAQGAYERESSWREGVRSALARLLMFMDAEPGLANLCIVESLAAGERVLQRRTEAFDELVGVIEKGRSLTAGAREPPALTAEGVLGGILEVIHRRLLNAEQESLMSLLGPLMSIIVLPYLGGAAASQELKRTAVVLQPEDVQDRAASPTDPMAGLKMRLTYRTVRVLTVVAKYPGASNREIAERSDISDQGQISKLMNRLARLELVENLGEGQEKGLANEWRLTALGAQLEQATRPPESLA